MAFPEHIFKAYDIRGLVEGDMSLDVAYAVGRGFAQLLKEQGSTEGKRLIVGYDMRPSSLVFRPAVICGILDEGFDVTDIGLVSTPLFNFACTEYDECAGGIMITASHNPAEYNGFKMTMHSGLPIGKESGMSRLRDLARAIASLKTYDVDDRERVQVKDPLPDYLTKIFSIIPPSRVKPLHIVVDYGNGMGSATLPHLMKDLPITVESLYDIPDGTFPNHEANPLKEETLRDLQKKVLEVKADFGFALDGDADRIGLVNEKGEIVGPSFVGTLIGCEVAKQYPGGLMLYDLRSSRIIADTWEGMGQKTAKCPVGHALIKKQMKDTGAIFGSELSLHVYYHDLHDIESGDLSLMYLLTLVSETGKKISELVEPLRQAYAHSGEINFETEKKDEAMAALEAAYKSEALEVLQLDGLWMKLPWGWFNVRKSNTEPVLRLNLETPTKEETEKRVKEVKKIIETFVE